MDFKLKQDSDIMRAPMEKRLPKLVDPTRLAARKELLAGQVSPEVFKRLGDSLKMQCAATVTLRFAAARNGRIAVTGTLATALSAQCQRCLKPVEFEIEHEIDVQLHERQPAGAQGYVAEVDSDDAVEYIGKLDLQEFIEDELLLACPIVPLHEFGQCSAPAGGLEENNESFNDSSNGMQTDNDDATERPFADLADMLSNERKT